MKRWIKRNKSKDDENTEFAQRIIEDFKGIWPTTEEEYYKFKYQEELDSAKCDIEDAKATEIALALLKSGIDFNIVYYCTGLSKQEILDLAEEHDIKIDTK